MDFIQSVQQSIYSVFNPQGLKFLIPLCLGLNHLNEHRFRHNFKDCINALYSCSLKVENTLRKYENNFLLHCQHHSTFRMGLMNNTNRIDKNFSYLSYDNKLSLLLYGDSKSDGNKNNFILSASITYILETEIFDSSLSKWCMNFYLSLTLILLFTSIDTFHLVILI